MDSDPSFDLAPLLFFFTGLDLKFIPFHILFFHTGYEKLRLIPRFAPPLY